jgi:hypothetical protein
MARIEVVITLLRQILDILVDQQQVISTIEDQVNNLDNKHG